MRSDFCYLKSDCLAGQPRFETLPLKMPVISARSPGYMLHLDVKMAGQIPEDGGW